MNPFGARVRKVVGDLTSNKSRTALVVLAIAAGVAAIGMVAGARAMMLRSLDESRVEGAFPNATFVVDRFDAALVRRVAAVPGVAATDARRVLTVRIAEGEKTWRDITLYGAADFSEARLSRITPERGAWPPPIAALLLERASLAALGREIGHSLRLELPDGRQRTVRIAGTVHDVNAPSTNTSGALYGYVTLSTLRRLGASADLNQLHIAVRVARDRAGVHDIATRVRAEIEASGATVLMTAVPEPGKFWAHDQVQSMVLLLTVLGVVCLLMSGLLVGNIVSALVTQQVRQIGVMKAIGATARETAALYLATALVYGVVAVVAAVPIGAVAAVALVEYSTGLLNLDAERFALTPGVLALEIAAGLFVPLAASLAPVIAGSRTTVREAIDAGGRARAASARTGLVERLTLRVPRLPAAVRLAVTNTFRRKRRLLMTLGTLVLGGAIFTAVLSVRSSLASTLDDSVRYRNYDVDLTLERAYPARSVEEHAANVPGVAHAEAWAVAAAHRVRADGSESETLTAIGAPPATRLIRPIVLDGRWLRAGDARSVVVNSDVLDREPSIRVGDALTLNLNGRRGRWRVAGVVRGVLNGPLIYANEGPLTRAIGEIGRARRLEVVTERHDPAGQAAVARRVEERLKRAGFLVAATRTTADRRALDESNFGVLISFLLSMALLIAVVGGLGLMATMSLNVIERGREIGVLRAIGASDGAVVQVVVIEALVIAAMGWIAGMPLAIPVSKVLSDAVGELFLKTPLTYTFSIGGALVWLATVLCISALASVLPAWRAARLAVRTVLAFE